MSAGFCGVPTSTCRAEALSPYSSRSARYCSAVSPLRVNGSTFRYPISLRRPNTSSVLAMVAASVPKPMYSANVQSWIEILLVGTPLPAQSGAAADAADAVLTPPAARQSATMVAAMKPRSVRARSRYMVSISASRGATFERPTGLSVPVITFE